MGKEGVAVRPEDYEAVEVTITQAEIDELARRLFGPTPPRTGDQP